MPCKAIQNTLSPVATLEHWIECNATRLGCIIVAPAATSYPFYPTYIMNLITLWDDIIVFVLYCRRSVATYATVAFCWKLYRWALVWINIESSILSSLPLVLLLFLFCLSPFLWGSHRANHTEQKWSFEMFINSNVLAIQLHLNGVPVLVLCFCSTWNA